MKAYFFRILNILVLPLLFFSCSSDLDFDQVKDLKLEPVVVANLAYFDIQANKVIDNGTTNVIYDVRDFDIFKDKFFNNRLKRADFDVEIENTIQRAFSVNMLLMNANNDVLETISFTVPAYAGSPNVIKYPTEVFENQRLDLLKQTVKIGFSIVIAPGPPLNQNSTGSLKLRSGATAYLVIE